MDVCCPDGAQSQDFDEIFCPPSRAMKQRITYILHVPETFDPSQIRVEKKLLGVDIGAASKEHRLTCSFSELQPEV